MIGLKSISHRKSYLFVVGGNIEELVQAFEELLLPRDPCPQSPIFGEFYKWRIIQHLLVLLFDFGYLGLTVEPTLGFANTVFFLPPHIIHYTFQFAFPKLQKLTTNKWNLRLTQRSICNHWYCLLQLWPNHNWIDAALSLVLFRTLRLYLCLIDFLTNVDEIVSKYVQMMTVGELNERRFFLYKF